MDETQVVVYIKGKNNDEPYLVKVNVSPKDLCLQHIITAIAQSHGSNFKYSINYMLNDEMVTEEISDSNHKIPIENDTAKLWLEPKDTCTSEPSSKRQKLDTDHDTTNGTKDEDVFKQPAIPVQMQQAFEFLNNKIEKFQNKIQNIHAILQNALKSKLHSQIDNQIVDQHNSSALTENKKILDFIFLKNQTTHIEIKDSISNESEIYSMCEKIGEGSTAYVRALRQIKDGELQDSSQYVAKLFKKKEYFEQELANIEKLNTRMQSILKKPSPRFLQMVQIDEEKSIIIYKPQCRMIKNEEMRIDNYDTMKNCEPLHKDVMQMFECIEVLQNLGIVHRDINPQHFMKRLDTNEIILVDFGTAIFLPELPESSEQRIPKLNTSYLGDDSCCYEFRGSLEFAAMEILEAMVAHDLFTPHRRHDLESFVRTLMVYLSGLQFSYEELKDANVLDRAKKMIKCWKIVDSSPMFTFWTDAIEITRSYKNKECNQLELLKNHINTLFTSIKK